MGDYIESLRRVAARADAVLWPTHGPPRDDAAEYVAALVEHRLEREQGVLDALESGRTTIREIVELLYADVRVELHKAAGDERLVAPAQARRRGAGRSLPATRRRRWPPPTLA